jgi:TolB-like protein
VNRRALAVLLGAALLGACSTANIAVNKSFDFSRVKRVAVVGFKDAPHGPGTGDAVTSAFEQSLLAAGFDVLDHASVAAAVGGKPGPLDAKTAKAAAAKLGVDALVMGQITGFANARETKVNVDVLGNYDDPVYETRVMHTVDQNGAPIDLVDKVVVGHRRGQRYHKEPRSYTVPGKLAVSARMIYPANGAMVWSGTDETDAVYPDAARAIADDVLKAVKVSWPKK